MAFLSLITRGVFRGALAPAPLPVLQPSLIFDGGIFAVLLHFFFKNIKIWAFVNIKASAFRYFVPQTPTGALPLDSLGASVPQIPYQTPFRTF